MKKFDEYLKAKEAVVADYEGVMATKPEKRGKYPGQPEYEIGEILPYKNVEKDEGLLTADSDDKEGLGNMSTPGMEKATSLGEKPPKVKHYKPSKKQLQEYYKETKTLSDSEFVKYLLERNNDDLQAVSMVNDLNGEPFTPHPHEAICYIVSLMHNPKMVSRLIREVKRSGKLSDMVAELMDHPEFYEEAVDLIAEEKDGDKIANKFVRSMKDHYMGFMDKMGLSESVTPPLTHDEELEEEPDMSPEANDEMPEEMPEEESPEMPEKKGLNQKVKNNMPHNRMGRAMVNHGFKGDLEEICRGPNCP